MQTPESVITAQLLERIKANPDQFLLLTDFDGTAAPIVSEPGLAYIEKRVRAELVNMQDAVVFVTGRDVVTLDRLINTGYDDEIRFATIAEHGLTQRFGEEMLSALPLSCHQFIVTEKAKALDWAGQLLQQYHLDNVNFVSHEIANNQKQTASRKTVQVSHLVETIKRGSFAFHTRVLEEAVENKPEATVLATLKSEMLAYCEDLVEENVDFVVLPGHMVYEVKYKHIDKGKAIEAALDTRFKTKKCLVWACDDLAGTDGPAAEVIKAQGGIIIQVKNPNCPQQYADPAYPNRHPDLFVESPAELADLLRDMKLAREAGLALLTTPLAELNAANSLSK